MIFDDRKVPNLGFPKYKTEKALPTLVKSFHYKVQKLQSQKKKTTTFQQNIYAENKNKWDSLKIIAL